MTPEDLKRLHALPDDALLDSAEAAAFLGLTTKGVEKLRNRRVIPFFKLSETCVRYRIGDLRRWVEVRRVPHVSQASTANTKSRNQGLHY